MSDSFRSCQKNLEFKVTQRLAVMVSISLSSRAAQTARDLPQILGSHKLMSVIHQLARDPSSSPRLRMTADFLTCRVEQSANRFFFRELVVELGGVGGRQDVHWYLSFL